MAGMSPRMKAKKGRFGAGGLPPTISILTPLSGEVFAYGAAVNFSGTASDDINGDVSASIVWTNDFDAQTATAATGMFMFTGVGSPTSPIVVVITASYTDGTTLVSTNVSVNIS